MLSFPLSSRFFALCIKKDLKSFHFQGLYLYIIYFYLFGTFHFAPEQLLLFPLDFRFFNHRDFHCFFVILLSTFCIFHHGDFICGSFCTHFVLRVNRVELHYFLDIQRFHLVFEEDNL